MTTKKPSRLFLVILVASMLGACGKAETSADAGKPPASKVKLATLQSTTVASSTEFIATLESRKSITLQPQIVGHVTKILVKYGQEVPKGKELIEIDPAQQQAAVTGNIAAAQGAQADVQNAKATLSQLQAQRVAEVSSVTYNQKQYQRYTYLSNQGAVPVQNRDQYADSIRQAQSRLSAIDQQIQAQRSVINQKQQALQQAQANIKQQKVELGYYKITAPFAGTVGDIPVKLGDYVTATTTLTTLTQNQPLEVNISIPIEDAPKLHQGMLVELMNGQGKAIGPSRVFFIAPRTDSNTQSVLVKSLFENSKNQLRANQYVQAKVIWDQHPGMLIPTTAVSHVGGENFVYVAQPQAQPQGQDKQGQDKQGKPQFVAREKPVQLGAIQGNNYQVISGLNPGDKLIISGILNLSDGAPIVPES